MKTHLLDSSDPIIEGQTRVAKCGATVEKAALLDVWNEEMAIDPRQLFSNLWRVCRKCKNAPLTGPYIYAITDGENAKQRERERAAD